MTDRASKITLAFGICAGVAAFVLALAAGTKMIRSDSSVNINIGFDHGAISGVLATLSIICLILGSAFLVRSKTNQPDAAMSEPNSPSFLKFLQELKRSKTDCWLGGVCGGLGAHSPVPSWVWRLVFLLLLFCFGTGLLAYIVLWICIPEEKSAA